MVDLSTPQARVAQQFMRDKGVNIEPYEVDKLDGQPCYYFYYRLPEGNLELEVNFNGYEWETTVTLFTLAS